VVIGITISVIGILLVVSPLFAWSFLVLNTLSTCGFLKPKLPSSSLTLYFVVSVLGSLLFLVSSGALSLSGLLLQLSLLLKIGLAPFQFWVSSVLRCLDLVSLFLFLGPMKSGFLFLWLSATCPSYLLALPSLLLGVSLLWLGSHVWTVIYASGSSNLFILQFLSPSALAPYWFIYCVSLFGLALLQYKLVSSFLAFLNLGAVPPLSMFWGKVLVLRLLPTTLSLLVLTISIISLWPYVHCSLTDARDHPSSWTLLCLLISVPALVFSFQSV